MSNGLTFGTALKIDKEDLFNDLQTRIAGMTDDSRIKDLIVPFADLNTLRNLPKELTDFSHQVREGKIPESEIAQKLESIAVAALRCLRKADLEKKGTDYPTSSKALKQHFYMIGRVFGIQSELSDLLDKWEQAYPYTGNQKELTAQEQKEAAFREIGEKFPVMYRNATGRFGYDIKQVLDGCATFVRETMISEKGYVADFFGVSADHKLDLDEQKQRVAVMKAWLKPMLLEALRKDARKATRDVFEIMAGKEYSTDASLKGQSASDIAREMMLEKIANRCKTDSAEFAAYRPLVYYWPEESISEPRDISELYKNLIYLAQIKWNGKVRYEQQTEKWFRKIQSEAAADPQYFDGYVPPKKAAPKPDQAPSVSGSAATSAPDGEGNIHDIAALQAELAARANYSSKSAISIPKPEHVPAPQPDQRVIVDSSITGVRTVSTAPAAPSSPANSPAQRQRTLPEVPAAKQAAATQPATAPAPKPVRPSIQIARTDMETTQLTPHTKAKQARENGGSTFTKWLKRGAIAAAAALGITAFGVATSDYERTQHSHDDRPSPSQIANQNAPKNASPADNPTAAPSVSSTPNVGAAASAIAANPAPTTDIQSGGNAAAPQVQPQVETSSGKAPEVASVLGSQTYDLGKASGAKPFTGTASLVEGGVDATPFSAQLQSAAWYESQQKTAELLLKIYDTQSSRLDKDTAEYVKMNEKILRDLASQSDFKPMSFKMKFEFRHGSQEIFGAKGIYNSMLAFQRVLDLYGKDAKKLEADKAGIKLTIGKKLNASEERFAKAVVFKSAPAVTDPTKQPDSKPQPDPKQNNAPQDNGGEGGSKTGFNLHQGVDNLAPAMNVPQFANARLLASSQDQQLHSDNLDTAFETLDQHTTKIQNEVDAYVAEEDYKLLQFEESRRSRGFFTKLADFGRYIWSGTTPEERAYGLQGIGGIRGFLMSDTQRMAEFNQRVEMEEKIMQKTQARAQTKPQPQVQLQPKPVKIEPVQTVAVQTLEIKPETAPKKVSDPMKFMLDARQAREEAGRKISALLAKQQQAKAEKDAESKRIAEINRLKDKIETSHALDEIDAGWDKIAEEHAKSAAKKKDLRDQLDAKLDKLFANIRRTPAQATPASEVKEEVIELTDADILEVTENEQPKKAA